MWLTEGIEDGLAVLQTMSEPTWALLGTSNFKTVELPENIRQVILAPDGDAAGQAIIQVQLLKPALTRQLHHTASGGWAPETRVEARSGPGMWSRPSEGAEGAVRAFSGRTESVSVKSTTRPAACATSIRSWDEKSTADGASLSNTGFPFTMRPQFRTRPHVPSCASSRPCISS